MCQKQDSTVQLGVADSTFSAAPCISCKGADVCGRYALRDGLLSCVCVCRRRMSAELCLQHRWLSQDVTYMRAKRLSTTTHRRFFLRRQWQVNYQAPFTQYNLLSNRLYNRFDNRLCRVNGVSVLSYFTHSTHLSYDDGLQDKREDYHNCSVLCCVRQLYTMIRTRI